MINFLLQATVTLAAFTLNQPLESTPSEKVTYPSSPRVVYVVNSLLQAAVACWLYP